ncbi:MAG: dTDP-4-dehydrorhamnose 3,5-epimerase family protein [Candidatus Cloacimonetes bacterium]|nr:dTDP-4-dehydrorhamnose 3,5-epimerase family protein [Candidatus Cloacimonadota bacterium]
MNRFDVTKTPLDGLLVLHKKPLCDDRGHLSRLFCQRNFFELGLEFPIVQINHTLTKQSGTVRGMHYQNPPYAEKKLVQCIRGSIWDVAVDLRSDSESFLQWFALELCPDNQQCLYIPEGFAHGFQTLEDNSELLYFHSEFYVQNAEGGLNPLDDRLDISWPLPVVGLSERDKNHPLLSDKFKGVCL